jgi:hypothetical protein
MVFKNLCRLVDEKSKVKVFACFYKITANYQNQLINPIQRPYNGDFDPGNAYRKSPVILKIVS